MQEDVHIVYQGLESEERGRKGSGMKMPAENWARAVILGTGFMSRGSVLRYKDPEVRDSPQRGLREDSS